MGGGDCDALAFLGTGFERVGLFAGEVVEFLRPNLG